jgi:hypothetical protein
LKFETDKLTSQFNLLSSGSSSTANNDKIEEICINLNSVFNKLNSSQLISDNLVLIRNVKDISDNVEEIKMLTSEFLALFYQRGDLSSGQLNQWHNRLVALEEIPKGSLSGKASNFIEKVGAFSNNFLINRDPDELEKLIDFWQVERNLSIAENSAGFDTEIKLKEFFNNTNELKEIYRKAGSSPAMGLQATLKFNLLQIEDLSSNIETESENIYQDFSRKILIRFSLLILFFGGLILAIFYNSLNKTHNSHNKLKTFHDELKSGKEPEKLVLYTSVITRLRPPPSPPCSVYP